MIRKVGLHLSPWVEWQRLQSIAYQTKSPEDIAAALEAFRRAYGNRREMDESERWVHYEYENT